jgi:hypothetical protein
MIVKIPFHDELAVLVHMNVSWRVITSPRDENVVAASNLAHTIMLPRAVTDVKRGSRVADGPFGEVVVVALAV